MWNVSVYVDVQSRWASLFEILFASVSFKDETMPYECAIQSCHLDCIFCLLNKWWRLVDQLRTSSDHLYLTRMIIFSCAMWCEKISPSECDSSCFASVLGVGDLWDFSFLFLHLILRKISYSSFHFKVSMCKLLLSHLCKCSIRSQGGRILRIFSLIFFL